MLKHIKTYIALLGMWVRYILTLLIKLLAWPISLPLYPIAYFMRDVIRNPRWMLLEILFIPLWFCLDDENDYGEEFFFLEHPKAKKNFWLSFKWAWARNNCTNLSNTLKYDTYYREILIRAETNNANISPLQHFRFKWEKIGRSGYIIDGWEMNQGDRLSKKYTSLGTSWALYTAGENRLLYFRASSAQIIGNKIMLNYKFGWNDKGQALFDMKFKLFKKKYTNHWDES